MAPSEARRQAPPAIRVAVVRDEATLTMGAALFDEPLETASARRFLAGPGHHLLFAWLDGNPSPIGMISGVEMTHPDKGTEMFVYELGVAENARRRGVATALLHALADLARERGCYGMWVTTEPDNEAALATYRTLTGTDPDPTVTFAWEF